MNYGCFTTLVGKTAFITTVFASTGALPSNATPLTQAQYLAIGNQPGWSLVNGVPTAPPANYNLIPMQQAKIQLLRNALAAALVAPYTYTTVGGVTGTFPMDSDSQRNYSRAYTTYVRGGLAVPVGFFFWDVNDNMVLFTLQDIKNFYLTAFAREQALYPTFQNLYEQVMAATSVSAIQAINWPTT